MATEEKVTSLADEFCCAHIFHIVMKKIDQKQGHSHAVAMP